MKVLNLLSSGGIGGIEQLCKCIGRYADYENTFCFLFDEGTIYDEMKQLGLNVVSLTDKTCKKFTVSRWRDLCNIISEYDIVVTHHCAIALQIYYSLLRKRFKSKKFVMAVHSCFDEEQNYNYSSAIKNKCAEYTLKSALKSSDKIIFVSEAGRKSYLSNFMIPVRKTKVIYNGIELQNVISLRSHKTSDYYRLTYIGRLEKVKGVDLLLKAVKKFLEYSSLGFKVWIIGDGSYRNELEKVSTKLELDGVVEFLGERRDIGLYLSQTDVFIYPSVCEEVFGISLVEAMSYGVPCVSNRVGGIPEIIDNGLNGFLSNEKTGNAIYEAIFQVLQKYENGTIDKMKKNCLNTAQKFNIKNTVSGLKIVYEELLND